MAKQITRTVLENSRRFGVWGLKNLTTFGESIQISCNKARLQTIRGWKYCNGWTRLRNSYVGLIIEFEALHNEMTHLIETGDVKHNPKDREKYETCKAKISSVIRATRRIRANNRITNRSALLYLNGYFSRKSWVSNKYQPAENARTFA